MLLTYNALHSHVRPSESRREAQKLEPPIILASQAFLAILAPMVQRGVWGALKRQAVCWGNEVHAVATPRLAAWRLARAAPTSDGLERSEPTTCSNAGPRDTTDLRPCREA
jgi:hypothetical protein